MANQPLYTRYRLVKRRKPTKVVWLLPLVGAALGGLAVYLWQNPLETHPPQLPPGMPSVPAPLPVPNQGPKTRPIVVPPPAAPATVANPITARPATVPTSTPANLGNALTPKAVSAPTVTPIAPSPLAVAPAAPATPVKPARPAPAPTPSEILAAQIQLNRLGISSGSIDGRLGSQTAAAVKAFQRLRGLPETGVIDAETKTALNLPGATYAQYVVTAEDLAGLRPLGETWLAKSQQDRLGHETLLELVAEKNCAHPNLIQRLNPGRDWNTVLAGETIMVPSAAMPPPTRAARVRISLSQRTLEAFDANDQLLAHFPCSIGRIAEKRPVGELRVINVAPNPDYTFDPALFSESPEARTLRSKLHIPPGPNNPVGMAWIGLDRPGFGIHGTPGPEQVGRTESHGCFRLANWNAELLLRMVWVGMPILVEP